jgi:outer membrane biogenesis lipoprotein LolB
LNPYLLTRVKNYPYFFRLLLLVLLSTGCQPRVEQVAPHFFKDSITTDYILKRQVDRAEKIKNFKSFTRTTFLGPKLKQSFRQSLLVQDNESIRIDTYGLFGQVLGVFTLHENRTVFFDPAKGRVYSEAEVESLMDKMLGTQVDFHEHLRIFVGDIPRLELLEILESRLNSDQTRYILQLKDVQRGGSVTLQFSAMTLLPFEMTRELGGRSVYSVQWQEYAKVEGHDFPHLITLSFPEKHETIRVKYKKPIINHGLPADTFKLPALKSR